MKTIYREHFEPYLVKNPLLFIYLKGLKKLSILFFIKKKKPSLKTNKILLCHLAHRGDVILATSIIPEIKKIFPQSTVGFLIGSWSKNLLINHPLIDKIFVFDHPKLNREAKHVFLKIIRGVSSFFACYRAVKKENFDLFLDLYLFYPNGNFLSFIFQIPQRIGFLSGGGERFLTFFLKGYDLSKHLFCHYLELLNHLDKNINAEKKLKPCLFLLEKPLEVPFKDFWIFHPYSGDPQKDLEKSFWKDLLRFANEKNLKIIFTGAGINQKNKIDQIISDRLKAANLAGKTTLDELVYLIKKSSGVICADSMIAHIAQSESIPCIVVGLSMNQKDFWYDQEKFFSLEN